jgi:hypothetical protein
MGPVLRGWGVWGRHSLRQPFDSAQGFGKTGRALSAALEFAFDCVAWASRPRNVRARLQSRPRFTAAIINWILSFRGALRKSPASAKNAKGWTTRPVMSARV